MNNQEIELESFAAAFLSQDSILANEEELTRVYEPPLGYHDNLNLDYEAMAEVPAALNAYIENQQKSEL